VRRQGIAINDQGTETGVTAIGRAARGPDGTVVAAVSLAIPTARFRRERIPEWTQHLATTVSRIEHDLAANHRSRDARRRGPDERVNAEVRN
jgi:DNA-binding IclR family transcriptional regulator